MATIFLATLGERPEAITVALDVLKQRIAFDTIGIIASDPQHSKIRAAYRALKPIMQQDYTIPFVKHIITQTDGSPFIDITGTLTAETYYRAILSILHEYRITGDYIHLLVAGGRKAMSIYATLAASLVFSSQDVVWTVISEKAVMQPGMFHMPVGQQDAVHLIRLPLLPSRFMPATLANRTPEDLLTWTDDSRVRFIQSLTKTERHLATLLADHPLATNEQLAGWTHKSEKTIENQFTSLYSKLGRFFELDTHRRQILIQVMQGRI